jgi:hypothetical protein
LFFSAFESLIVVPFFVGFQISVVRWLTVPLRDNVRLIAHEPFRALDQVCRSFQRAFRCCSRFRATVHPNGIAGDPAGIVGGKESDDRTNIFGLGQTLDGLHAQRKIPTGVCLGEIRQVGFDDSGGYGVDPDSARAKRGGEVFYQRSIAPFVAA